jgi:hypothetical protein
MCCLLQCMAILLLTLPAASAEEGFGSWHGIVRDGSGQRLSGATVRLKGQVVTLVAKCGSDGTFEFVGLRPGRYMVTLEWEGKAASSQSPIEILANGHKTDSLRLTINGTLTTEPETGEATGGEDLSSSQVSGLPLNKRDFSHLLRGAADGPGNQRRGSPGSGRHASAFHEQDRQRGLLRAWGE